MLFDNSLSLINRTGAYYIARDLCREFVPAHAQVRYWRLGSRAPEGVARKLMARLMMMEIDWLGDRNVCLIGDTNKAGNSRVFLDPLYVLRSRLDETDIVLCHDVGPLTHSGLYDTRTVANYRLAYDKIARARPGIVFVSDWSRCAFKALYGSDFRWLKTISLYVREELFNGVEEPVPGIDGRFFLTVGAFETRKNQIAAIEAFHAGRFHEQGVRYVLCGSRGLGHDRIAEVAQSVPGVVMLNYVADPQLRWLYAKAEAFVLPSLLEGFGMPALEAAYMGLLPIVSADSALVEAVRGICLEVDPHDPQSIAVAMARALANSPGEKAKASRKLRDMALLSTKQRFLSQWRELLSEGAGSKGAPIQAMPVR
ncbi:glycosyltransferase [Aminobacter sp. HY435]|uniref:glycosyltransferase n=1 Tax=Aminobacter sp. HY435 TaxID=2970917 RepID=UPI0022B9B4B4|nr:glycosyltransferase [Aminobacter sp. HY435]